MARLRFALLGWPVQHSVSPPMQEAGFRALGLMATYELVPTPPDQVAATVGRLRDSGYAGWNVTVPHKEAMAELVDEIDSGASAAASVNTVVNRVGRLLGYSTDGYGLQEALREGLGVPLPGRALAFLGIGGAARACCVHAVRQGARELVLVNRTVAKAEALAEVLRRVGPACRVRVVALADTECVQAALRTVDALVQSTSLGLHAGDPLPLVAEALPPGLPVMDMIYRTTPFLAAAAERGCRTADGRGMLLHQGALSLSLWTGRPAPLEAMRAALDRALGARS